MEREGTAVKASILVSELLRDFLESILEEDLVLSPEREVFDRYERPLVYLSAEDQNTYNLRLVQTGHAIPYFIYPNAHPYVQ